MSMKRRNFIKTAVAGTAAAHFASIRPIFGAEPKPLRIAQVGCGGRGKAHHMFGRKRGNKFVAACDTNRNTLKMFNKKRYPHLKKYTNYLKMFENEMDNIDAVVVATPDHNHFSVAMLALAAGKAVYCEKPLTWSVQEALDLKKKYEELKTPTQMGNQGNAKQGWRDCFNIVHSDIIGKVTEVKTWTDRPIWPQGNPKPTGPGKPVPDHIDWEAWIGPAPMRPFNKPMRFDWRGFIDFGCGALGDMSCHTMNAMFQIMKPEYDCTVEPIKIEGATDDQWPNKEIIKWTFAKKGDCPGFDCYWYDGNLKPDKPEHLGEHPLPKTGSMFVGEKGVMISASDYNEKPVVYQGGKILMEPKVEKLAPPTPTRDSIHWNFLDVAAGLIPHDKAVSNWSYAGKMTAIISLGPIAQRLNKKLTFKGGRNPRFKEKEANKLMSRKPREGWDAAYKIKV